ncbi:MAG: amidohydrolase family protein [Anaerolineales bacterium]|nr:amidohydrolase family protein [Anaerolineales bacterium]
MIDFHVHFGNMAREGYPAKPPLSVHQLIDRMNREGIDRAVLLPLESPEGSWGYLLTEQVVEARNAYPERFIAFFDVDPRYPSALAFIDYFVKEHGCVGMGEHVNGLALDDPLNMALYARCNDYGLPIDVEINKDHLCRDDIGLPRLERCLREFPDVAWCGHGPGFWSSISGDDDGRRGYPSGPITPGGALDRLLERYDNLYCDLSAFSGYNALTRDPEFTQGFIERHWRRMLLGTDIVFVGDALPILDWMRTLNVGEEKHYAICEGNARRVLKME